MATSTLAENRHHLLAQYLIAHPTASRKQVAAAMGASEAWVTSVTNSDAFREYLRSLDQEVLSDVVVPIRSRLMGVAETALLRLEEKLAVSQDPRFILDAADKALHRLGYAPSKGPTIVPGNMNVTQNTTYVIGQEELKVARERLHQSALAAPQDNPMKELPYVEVADTIEA